MIKIFKQPFYDGFTNVYQRLVFSFWNVTSDYNKWFSGTRTDQQEPGIELNGQVPANPCTRLLGTT